MAATDKQKQSLYFPEDTLQEIMAEAVRLDRSLSWTVQQAWRLAREQVSRFPSANPRAPDREPRLTAVRQPRPDAERPLADLEQRPPSDQVLEFLRGKFDRDLSS